MIVKFPHADQVADNARVVGRNATSVSPQIHVLHPSSGPTTKVGNNSKRSSGRQPTPGRQESHEETVAGQLAAQTQAITNLRAALAQLTASISSSSDERQRQVIEMRSVAVELAAAIATRICHEKIAAGTYPLENVVDRLLSQLIPDDQTLVYLHPVDLAILTESDDSAESIEGVTFQSDPQLQRGECRASNGQDGLISTIDLQTAELRQRLLEGVNDAWQ